jgi:hypothetical protein
MLVSRSMTAGMPCVWWYTWMIFSAVRFDTS